MIYASAWRKPRGRFIRSAENLAFDLQKIIHNLFRVFSG